MNVEQSAALLSRDLPLRAARMASKRTLRDVAAAAHVDDGQLSRIERGLERPSVDALYRLAVALGLVEMAANLQPYAGPARRP